MQHLHNSPPLRGRLEWLHRSRRWCAWRFMNMAFQKCPGLWDKQELISESYTFPLMRKLLLGKVGQDISSLTLKPRYTKWIWRASHLWYQMPWLSCNPPRSLAQSSWSWSVSRVDMNRPNANQANSKTHNTSSITSKKKRKKNTHSFLM